MPMRNSTILLVDDEKNILRVSPRRSKRSATRSSRHSRPRRPWRSSDQKRLRPGDHGPEAPGAERPRPPGIRQVPDAGCAGHCDHAPLYDRDAVDAMKDRAFNYLTKPVNPDELPDRGSARRRRSMTEA